MWKCLKDPNTPLSPWRNIAVRSQSGGSAGHLCFFGHLQSSLRTKNDKNKDFIWGKELGHIAAKTLLKVELRALMFEGCFLYNAQNARLKFHFAPVSCEVLDVKPQDNFVDVKLNIHLQAVPTEAVLFLWLLRESLMFHSGVLLKKSTWENTNLFRLGKERRGALWWRGSLYTALTEAL